VTCSSRTIPQLHCGKRSAHTTTWLLQPWGSSCILYDMPRLSAPPVPKKLCVCLCRAYFTPGTYTRTRTRAHTHTRTHTFIGPSAEKERANLSSLGLDRPTLERQGVAPHHINRVYSLLHANAMAFALTVAAEQRRLAALFTTKVQAGVLSGVECSNCSNHKPKCSVGCAAHLLATCTLQTSSCVLDKCDM